MGCVGVSHERGVLDSLSRTVFVKVRCPARGKQGREILPREQGVQGLWSRGR